MTDVTYRAAGPGDDERIRALLAVSYPDNVKAQAPYTDWQYWSNPFGATVSWIAEADGAVVAHWAAVRVPMIVDGQPVAGAKTADAATDPDFRHRGLFSQVGERMVADAGARGVRAVISHPNPDAARGVAGAGAALVSRAAAHVRPLDDDWLRERYHVPRTVARRLRASAFRLRRGDAADVADVPPEGLDDLWSRAGAGVRNGIARHAAWWDWRYRQRPHRPYVFVAARRGGRLTGAACVTVAERFGGRFGLVLEYLAEDEAAARGLTAALGESARGEGAVGLALVTLPGSRLASQCSAAGFRRLPRRLEPRPLRMMVFDPGGDAAALAARPWSMAWGDLDHI